MVVSTAVDVYLMFDIYKAFHEKREIFQNKKSELLLALSVIVINVFVNMRNSNILNLAATIVLSFVCGLVLVAGDVWSKIFHWLILLSIILGSEFIFSILLSVSVNDSTNEIYSSEFTMVSSIIAVKLIEFVILTIVKQISKVRVKKVSAKVFACFIIVPVATLGLMTAIPYVRVGDNEITSMDMVVLVFYMILLCGNVSLFYIFTKYSQLQEERMVLEVSQTKYEERSRRYSKEGELDERYKERIHDIKYYLKQIGIYLNENRYEEIREMLEELQIDIHKHETDKICANRFLNSLLADFQRVAGNLGLRTEVFVEAGFKIEYMKEIDIMSLFGNLLDNAIEAAQKCETGIIKVSLYMQNQGDIAVYSIENNYDGKINRKGDKLLTTKEDEWGHGIGLGNVRRVVDSYNGYIQQDFDENYCTTTVLVPTGQEM
jgi:hypothetical protein